ncbi:ImmA/IrrE family metallo-endopeptidase [Cnuibacter physcomitrellae]|uniref:ImmA/IrrE family metallo-endopeptidase n=1 Tax=Cnuibacter physcomitrellae TaxID=1619308 RepID=UPI002175B8DB|nr:ImmA/IrrE family metallo-endopeptidase [Cnuibacter physcomitrellae]MCS5498205.1 ImmA/IrrE family metallo-endopeptidase [Cnuibacter physcomitrellae]
MTSEDEFRALIRAKNYRQIAIKLIALEAGRGVFDIEALQDDPENAVSGNDEVAIEYDMNPRDGCSVFGYYRHVAAGQSMILVHPSLTSERDRFTILHELGHHVQRQHRAWANVRYSLPTDVGARLEERVADAFAAEVLIPAGTVSSDSTWLSARTLAGVYAKVRASRAAVAMRAIEISPEGDQATVVVADYRGMVTFARASGDEVFAPARGRVQPGIAKMIETALEQGGSARGMLDGGLVAASGWAQEELAIEVALDDSWGYAFAVARPAQRFGRKPVWSRVDEVECGNEACGAVFAVDQTVTICSACGAPKCPECARCACELKASPVCATCFLELTPAEQANPTLHECT